MRMIRAQLGITTGTIDDPVKAKAGVVGVITAGGCWMLLLLLQTWELGMLLKLLLLLEALLGRGQLTGHGRELSGMDPTGKALRRYP